jgi:alpha-glucosidase (family GH31 glycosyl hydrolase)
MWMRRLAHAGHTVWRCKRLLVLPAFAAVAEHFDNSTEYDAHNLYGFAMAKHHYQAAANIMGRRPFLLTRCVL